MVNWFTLTSMNLKTDSSTWVEFSSRLTSSDPVKSCLIISSFRLVKSHLMIHLRSFWKAERDHRLRLRCEAREVPERSPSFLYRIHQGHQSRWRPLGGRSTRKWSGISATMCVVDSERRIMSKFRYGYELCVGCLNYYVSILPWGMS